MITLYDYQQMALSLIINAFLTRTSALAVMATGLGKTVVSAFWAKEELKKKRKGLFLCHDTGILEQAMKEFKKVLGEKYSLSSFFGNSKDWRADEADMVFASFQTYGNWKHAFFEDEFDFMIVDESHHGQAPTFKDVILYFKPKKLLGITATPDRMDLKDIREIFGEEVVNYTLEEAIANGWLTQVEYHILNDNLSHWKLKKIVRDVLEKGERVSIKQINESIFIKKRDEEIAKMIQEYTGSSKKAIIFCEKIEHADNFQKYLPDSATYHSKVAGGAKENRKRLDAFREGSLQHILAVDKFNEGIDVPDAEVIVFLRCTDSETIFYQQLGRGLRKIFGKKKVIVMDFVANCERLALVKEMAERVKTFAGNHFMLSKEMLHVSGATFDFVFSDEQVDIVNLIKRINEPFYETWREASRAAIKLEVKSVADYKNKYKADPRLPSDPYSIYDNFPGWRKFLGGEDPYPDWREASVAALKLGIKSQNDYRKKAKDDPALPSTPDRFYKNFPGWGKFLDKFYETWQEASKAAIGIGIRNSKEYKKKYKTDFKLPSEPKSFYGSDFPGWDKFLDTSSYSTWKEASKVVIDLGVKDRRDYRKRYKIDRKLPAVPEIFYKADFPGWVKFLGRTRRIEKNFYASWEEAGRAAKKLGIKTELDYGKKHKKDPRLPATPSKFYKNFPDWYVFLGKEKKNFYPTWQEASKAAIALGIKSITQYRDKGQYKKDTRLPIDPRSVYPDFPGWDKFLGKEE